MKKLFFAFFTASAMSVIATPLSVEQVTTAAENWAKSNPLFGMNFSVATTEQAGEMVFVCFKPRGSAVFSMDTTFVPCRWFSTSTVAITGDSAQAALKSAGEANDSNMTKWNDLLKSARRSGLSVAALPENSGSVVGPLIKRNWSQERHYNRMCPLKTRINTLTHLNDDRMYSGCVAVALAMFIDYYKWPFRGVGSTKTKVETYWDSPAYSTQCRTDFGADYDFDSMLDRYLVVASQKESMEVAQLMSDCGAVLEMQYGDDASSSYFDNYASCLEDYFGYKVSGSITAKINDKPEEYVPMVKKALQAGCPILCNGQAGVDANGEAVGHAYLCDGYCEVVNGETTTTYYHFNFGWNGSGNDWCTSDNVITHAIPGETATQGYAVANMLINVFPSRNPLFHRLPSVTNTPFSLKYNIANFWTNKVSNFSLDIQKLETVTVNEEFSDTAWNIRMLGWGWKYDDTGKATASTLAPFGYGKPTYPTSISACLKGGIAVSADTTLTINYSIKKLDTNVSLFITTCDEDGNPLNYDNSNKPTPRLATITGGTSTTSFTDGSIKLTGSSALSSLIGQQGVRLCFYFYDSGSGSTLYSGNTEVFKINSSSISGSANDWVTKETKTLAATERFAMIQNLPDGKYKFILTSNFPDSTNGVFSGIMAISATDVAPTIKCVEGTNSLVYTIANANSYSYGFRSQNETMSGTAVKNGNTVTYTLPKPINELGTHWVELFVTNTVTGFHSMDYHVVNKPAEVQLSKYTEYTLEDAVARASKENKNICMLSIKGQYGTRFIGLDDILSTNVFLEAIASNYVFWENYTGDTTGYSLTEQYWKQQPRKTWGSQEITNCYPELYGYMFLISPTNATEQLHGDELPLYYTGEGRWAYKNAQYDIQSITDMDAEQIHKFLTQPFPMPNLPPTIDDPEIILPGLKFLLK